MPTAVVSPDSEHLADQPGEDDGGVEVSAEVADSAAAADIGSDVDSGSVTAEPYDAPDTSSSVTHHQILESMRVLPLRPVHYDSGSTTDTGSSTDK